MRQLLRHTAAIAVILCIGGLWSGASAQTSTGRFTVNMPHGPVVMQMGRTQASESVTDNDRGSRPAKSAFTADDAVEETTLSTDTSGVIYDPNEKVLRYGSLTYRFVPVKSCTFTMGATEEQGLETESLESPRHRVSLFTYWLGSTEVPQWLWQAVMNGNPSKNVDDNNPVENVSWNDCNAFVEELSRITGKNIGLPTEAQMELALRDGDNDNQNKYGTSRALEDVAWYGPTSDGRTHKVGLKNPNGLGLYDMIGNVGEWCSDWFDVYPGREVVSPTGPQNGTKKVYRSATYTSSENDCRTAARFAETPDFKSPEIGLRLVLK